MKTRKDKEYQLLWSTTLEKLNRISELEKQHNVAGISFAIEEGKTVTMEESLDFVIDFIKNAAHFIANGKNLYKPGFCPPK